MDRHTLLRARVAVFGLTGSNLANAITLVSGEPAGFVGSLSYTPTAVILNLTGALSLAREDIRGL
jgi:hypothetical protein